MIQPYDNPLPDGWNERPLKEVTVRKRGYSWDKEQETTAAESGAVPVIRIPNVGDSLDLQDLLHLRGVPEEALKQSAVSKDWILFVASNGNPERIGDSVLIEEDREMVFASFLLGIKPKNSDALLPEFFARWMRLHNVHEAFSRTSQQTTGLANFSWSAVKKLPMRFPADLAEQQAIVSVLRSVDEAIAKAKDEIEATRRLKKALMRQLFTRGVPGRHTRFKQTKIGEVPEEWDINSLMNHCGSFSCVRTGPFGAQLPPDAFERTGVRMVNITDIGDGCLEFTTTAYIRDEVADYLQEYQLVTNDLVFSRVASVGRVAMIEEKHTPLIMSSNCIRLRPGSSFNSYFLMQAFINAESVSRQVVAASTGGSRAIVTPRFLRRMLIPRPDINEQNEIASVIQSVEKTVAALSVELQSLSTLKTSLLQNLLTGKVRVKPEVSA